MPAHPSNDLLLITCASGKQATRLLPLLSEWKRLRLAVHSSSSKDRLKSQYPRAEVVQTDLYSPENCKSLVQGVNVIIHIGPSYHIHEAEIGYMMIDAAVDSYQNGSGSLKHFIFSSVLNAQLRKMMNHDCKRVVEEYVMESGLPYTILQPTTFMDNIPIQVFMKQDKPKFVSAWSTDNKFSMIALRDLADAFHRALVEREKHYYAQYPLVSTHAPLSFGEVMATISSKIGKEIDVSVAPYKEAVDSVLVRLFGKSEGVDQRNKDVAQRMILFYDNRGLVGNPNVLEWLIGRDATQVEEWADLRVREESGR